MGPASGILAAHQILAGNEIRYWLDSGSLLGLIRVGQEIAWDSDIDVGIWESETSNTSHALKKLRSRGYRVSWRSYRGLIYGFTIEANNQDLLRPIHIHIYFQHGHIAWSPQTVVAYRQISRADADNGFAPWPRTRKALLYLREMARARQTGSLARKIWNYGVCYPAWGSLVMVRNRLERQLWNTLWPFSTMYAIYTWIIPEYFFSQLEHRTIEDIPIPVPRSPEDYLSTRYNEWQTPIKDWCYWIDDNCIVPKVPEEAIPDLAKQRMG